MGWAIACGSFENIREKGMARKPATAAEMAEAPPPEGMTGAEVSGASINSSRFSATTKGAAEPDWEAISVEEPDPAPVDPVAGLSPADEAGAVEAAAASAGLLPFATFHECWNATFQGVGAMSRLRTLQAVPENETSEPAAREVYAIIVETPALHWIVSPESGWFKRLAVIGAFGFSVGGGCYVELQQRREAARLAKSGGQGEAPAMSPGADPMARGKLADEVVLP